MPPEVILQGLPRRSVRVVALGGAKWTAREGEEEGGVDGGAAALGAAHGEWPLGIDGVLPGGPGVVVGRMAAAEQRPERARASHVRRNACADPRPTLLNLSMSGRACLPPIRPMNRCSTVSSWKGL